LRVLVCGSRNFIDVEPFDEVMDEYIGKITTIIHGSARGADMQAHLWGLRNNVPIEEYPADWKLHGKRAGPIRNSQMLLEGAPDLVVAFWDGESKGTKNMIEIAEKAGVKTIVIPIGSSL
jgi:hypothetical protein